MSDLEEAFTYANDRGAAPGVWPKTRSLPRHFQIVDERRALLVLDHHGVVEIGGVKVTDPAALTEFAARLTDLAQVFATRAEGER